MINFNEYANRLTGQPMFVLLDKIKKMESSGRKVIHFEIGDPDFKTPQKVIDACCDALNNGVTHYTSSSGSNNLKDSIAIYTERKLGWLPDIDQIVIGPGANPFIYAIIQCLVHAGDEVIIPDPSFPTYESVLKFLNHKIVRVPLREENQFAITCEDINKVVTNRTRLIILNSPHNPTGSIIPEYEMKKIYELCVEKNIFIISDEIYSEMIYDNQQHHSFSEFGDKCLKNVIIINGFSKGFAMTGWRLGYMIAPKELSEKIGLLLQTIVSCTPSFIQEAGTHVLNQEHPEIISMMKELHERRDLMVDLLNKIPGVSCLKPKGAFYCFANIKKTCYSSQRFSDIALERGGVAILPGTNFGKHCEGYVRLCYANNKKNIVEGLTILKDLNLYL